MVIFRMRLGLKRGGGVKVVGQGRVCFHFLDILTLVDVADEWEFV